MPIPEFNEIKAPALQLLSDGRNWRTSELYEPLAELMIQHNIGVSRGTGVRGEARRIDYFDQD